MLKQAQRDFSSRWCIAACNKYTPLLTNGLPCVAILFRAFAIVCPMKDIFLAIRTVHS